MMGTLFECLRIIFDKSMVMPASRMRYVVVGVSCNVNPNVMFSVDDDDTNVVISTMIVSS